MDRGFTVEAESYPYIEDADVAAGIHAPGDEPGDDTPGAPDRQPVVAVFTRLAVLSRQTGRWHKPAGRRDRHGDAPADASGERGDR
jgi:hypothetical protein